MILLSLWQIGERAMKDFGYIPKEKSRSYLQPAHWRALIALSAIACLFFAVIQPEQVKSEKNNRIKTVSVIVK